MRKWKRPRKGDNQWHTWVHTLIDAYNHTVGYTNIPADSLGYMSKRVYEPMTGEVGNRLESETKSSYKTHNLRPNEKKILLKYTHTCSQHYPH